MRCTVKQSAEAGYIRIEGGIDWWSNNAAQFRAAVDQLKNSGVKSLEVYLNSPGGSVFEANEIANILDSWKGEKYLTIGALCCSAATNLILPFDKKNVKAFSNITAMMHNPTISIFDAEEKDLLSNAKLLANTKKTYVKKMSARTGMSETQLSNKLDGTWWMTIQDLLDYNLVGSKVEEQDSLPPDTKNVFNAYRFENVPAVLNAALGVELLDEEDDDKTPPASGSTGSGNNPLKTTMKNLIQLLMVSLVALKNKLTENSSEAEVVAAITNAFNEKEQKISQLEADLKAEQAKNTALQTEVDNNTKNMIKARLDLAEKTEKKISPEQRKVFEDQVDKKVLNYENLNTLIEAMAPRQSVRQMLNNGGTPPANNGGNQEEERVEPEFSKGENGERIYTGKGEVSQSSVYARMVAEQNKK